LDAGKRFELFLSFVHGSISPLPAA